MRSLHSPPFSGRTPTGLRWTLGIQTGYFSGVPVQEFSGDFPVLVRCLSSMESKSTGLSGRTPDGLQMDLHPNSSHSLVEISRKSNGLLPDSNRTPTDCPDGLQTDSPMDYTDPMTEILHFVQSAGRYLLSRINNYNYIE